MKVETKELPNGGVQLIFSDFTKREEAIITAGAKKAKLSKRAFLKRLLIAKAREELAKLKHQP